MWVIIASLTETPYYYADWDVQDIYYSKAAPSQSHNISVQGSSGKTNYYLSFGYDEKEGIMKVRPDELKKYNVSVNVTTNLYDWLQVGARVNYSRKAYQRPDIYSSTYQTFGVGVLSLFLQVPLMVMTLASCLCVNKHQTVRK